MIDWSTALDHPSLKSDCKVWATKCQLRQLLTRWAPVFQTCWAHAALRLQVGAVDVQSFINQILLPRTELTPYTSFHKVQLAESIVIIYIIPGIILHSSYKYQLPAFQQWSLIYGWRTLTKTYSNNSFLFQQFWTLKEFQPLLVWHLTVVSVFLFK